MVTNLLIVSFYTFAYISLSFETQHNKLLRCYREISNLWYDFVLQFYIPKTSANMSLNFDRHQAPSLNNMLFQKLYNIHGHYCIV